jgi:hypothetical protein
MILVMFNDSEGTFPPVACCEGNVDSLCEDLPGGMYEGTCEDEEESDEAK